jgi:hypothetical protein
MRNEEFKKHLITKPVNNGKPYSDSTANERVRFCETIEKEFARDLDLVASDLNERTSLLANVKTMSRSHVNTYVKSLLLYYDFVDVYKGKSHSLIKHSMHFYINSTDFLPEEYCDIIFDLEGEYERILGFGRDLLGLDSSHLLKDSNVKRIERIPVVFRPEIKKITYTTDDDYNAERLLGLIREKGRDTTKKEILNILKNKNITDIIVGEFIAGEEPYIIIYYNAIKGNNRNELIAKVANVLAHEYMHYMEYVYCSAHGVAFYRNKCLSEAMADFFGVIYSINRHTSESIITARKRYDLWKKRFHSCWPYAGAWLFYRVSGRFMSFSDEYDKYVSHGSEKKLIDIFKKSFNADIAYDMLYNL